MRKLAPHIHRQRQVIEGIYSIDITPSKLKSYMRELSDMIGMTIIYGPIVKNLAGKINPIHKGLESFLIWAESGTQVYTWENDNFFTVDIYSCKKFDVNTAVNFTKEYFGTKEIVSDPENMKDLAPHIPRQRLVIEGIYSIDITPSKLKSYMHTLSDNIGMTVIYGPIVKNLAGKINPIHKGLESFLIWAESGTQVYTWENDNFFTVDIYSCKKFDVNTAVNFTKEYFGTKEIVYEPKE